MPSRSTSQSLNALPSGTVLHDYVIESELGSGGFSMVYLARHRLHTDWLFAIKEYLPRDLAVRDNDGASVHPVNTEAEDAFEDGRRRFRDEAEQLRRFRNERHVVSCLNYFEANGTAYLVMDYDDGLPLSEFLRQREEAGQPFTEADIRAVVEPLLEGLEVVHRAGVLHRDIKPGNVFVRRPDDIAGRPAQPVLIDFGAAKQNYLERHSRSRAPYTPGYAAYEQISSEGDIGPRTDIYAISALMWRMVAGGCPDDPRLLITDEAGGERVWSPTPRAAEKRAYALHRGRPDPMVSAAELGAGRFSKHLLESIDKCLTLYPEDRMQDCGEIKKYLQTKPSKSPRPSSKRNEGQRNIVSHERSEPFDRANRRINTERYRRGHRKTSFKWWQSRGLRKRATAIATTGVVFGSLTWLIFTALAEMRCERWNTADWWRLTNVTVETVQACLNAGADHEGNREYGDTPLHQAAARNANPLVVEALLAGGANVNAKDRYGYTPLHSAASRSTVAVVEMLLDAGADASAEAFSRFTPLHQVMGRGERRIIVALLEHGADVNAGDRYGPATPLPWAVGRNDLIATRTLLEHGAGVNLTDGNGDTPLHTAARDNSSPEIIEELLDAGACVNARNRSREFPWDLARNNALLQGTQALARISYSSPRLGILFQECETR